MKIRTKRTALYAWLPVLCLVALSLSTAPGSSEARQAGSLTIVQDKYYGGQGITFKGKLGTSGQQAIWLEFHMGREGDDWTRIEGSTRETDPDGSFNFVFPARGMDGIKLRIAANGTVTPDVVLRAHDQAAALSMQPVDLEYGDSACDGSRLAYLRYDAVASENYTLTVDSSPGTEPELPGRKVFLDERVSGNRWEEVAQGSLDGDGRATFTLKASTSRIAYRARLGEWNENGSKIGWFPSFPTYVEPHRRPDPIGAVDVKDPTADPWADPHELHLEWPAIADPDVKDILIAWDLDNTPPTDPASASQMVVRQADRTSLELDDLLPAQDYSFAIFTRSTAGICSSSQTGGEQTDPVPIPAPITGFAATTPAPDQVDLSWNAISPNPPAGQGLTELYVYRNGDFVAALSPTETTFTDTTVWPEGDFTYTIYAVNMWGEESPHATTFVQTPPAVTP